MKKKLDMYLIYLIYIFELIYTMSAMYFNNSMVSLADLVRKRL